MATITSTGIGSGIDIEGIVTKLVQVEGQAQSRQYDVKEADFQAKLSAFGTFKGALAALQSAAQALKDLGKFQGRQVTIGDTDILSASANSSAVAGTYSVEVQNLAAAQKLASKALGAADAPVGTGTLTLTAGGKVIAINIDSSNNTVSGIRDAINGAAGNTGVTASLITAADGTHLVLAANSTGSTNHFSLTASGGDGGLANIAYSAVSGTTANYPSVTDAQDAHVKIEGFAVTSATNTVTDALRGITLNLLGKSEADVPTSVTVGYDKTAARQSIDTFVKAYNNLIANAKNSTAYDTKTQASGPLLGDATLREVIANVRRALGQPSADSTAPLRVLADIGVTTNVDGTLTVDSAKIDDQISGNFDAVGRLFAGTQGIATGLDSLIDGYTKLGGVLDARSKGINSSIADIAKGRQELTDRLATYEKRLRAQFNALDSTIAQLRSTSNFLTQLSSNLGNLSSSSSSKSSG